MCDIGARCPNCGRDDLDDYEIKCWTVGLLSYRKYDCPCGALVVVEIMRPREPAGDGRQT